jgi:hypothetical protein
MLALQRISKHVNKINTNVIYLDQTLYNYLPQIAQHVHSQLQFEEQTIAFDFFSEQVHMAIDERKREVQRFQKTSVPKWFGVDLEQPDFSPSPCLNNILALIHLNKGLCQVKPASSIIDHTKK